MHELVIWREPITNYHWGHWKRADPQPLLRKPFKVCLGKSIIKGTLQEEHVLANLRRFKAGAYFWSAVNKWLIRVFFDPTVRDFFDPKGQKLKKWAFLRMADPTQPQLQKNYPNPVKKIRPGHITSYLGPTQNISEILLLVFLNLKHYFYNYWKVDQSYFFFKHAKMTLNFLFF